MFRSGLLRKAVRRRFTIHLPVNEGAFSGILVENDREYWVFEDCTTIAAHGGDTPTAIPGRVWVKHNVSPAPYLQETWTRAG
jgi:hypothetical protein